MAVSQEENPLRGIVLKLASVTCFMCMQTAIKLAGPGIATGQITFYRSAFAIFPIVVYLMFRGQLATALKTSRPFGHFFRGLVGVVSMSLGFYGLLNLPLHDAVALGYAMPLFAVLFAAVFLGETVRLYRLTAVVAGFVGVLVISWSKFSVLKGDLTESAQALGVLAIILSAALGATAMILVRKLVATEKSATIVLYFSITASVLSAASLPFGWADLSSGSLVSLGIAGICGGVAQILLTESYRHADISTIAPFEYVSILYSLIISYMLFAEVPEPLMLLGTAIVVAAGIFIIYRERKLGLERASMRKHVTPQG
ncbi:DMT family transporter [Rhizobium sp. L1K21]|uniref:DMT family transporter n=1 Tax=Rhizobium sp. L1K21 TaxID=2954933 RepID=UPI0020924BC5|nr:DMT family transporter [Rhizobium sp. L1K21]MCO6186662.1 DMT family transporter [Rhizobium sp. L1K21]